MDMLLNKVNQKLQKECKKFQDNNKKEYERTHKQMNEHIRALNKYQSETENTINREINELGQKWTILKRK
jgi:archaellum component FlaF (FlaF/FlaG flagellin family)